MAHTMKVAKAKNPRAGKLKHVRIEMADNGGATVHTAHHGTDKDPYPMEKMDAFNTLEEALHHAGKMMGTNVEMEDPAEEAGESAAVERAEHGKGKGKAA